MIFGMEGLLKKVLQNTRRKNKMDKKIKNAKWFEEHGFDGHDKIIIPLIVEHCVYNEEKRDWEENEKWIESDGLKTATEIIKEDPTREIAWDIIADYLKDGFTMAFGKDIMKNVVISIKENDKKNERK
jgi:hypothetical protein